MALDQEVKEILSKKSSSFHPHHARCFVRPSGTEDAVRIYSEASTQQDADYLAKRAKHHVQSHCGNVKNVQNSAEIEKVVRFRSKL